LCMSSRKRRSRGCLDGASSIPSSSTSASKPPLPTQETSCRARRLTVSSILSSMAARGSGWIVPPARRYSARNVVSCTTAT
jgi:hypothetical protein